MCFVPRHLCKPEPPLKPSVLLAIIARRSPEPVAISVGFFFTIGELRVSPSPPSGSQWLDLPCHPFGFTQALPESLPHRRPNLVTAFFLTSVPPSSSGLRVYPGEFTVVPSLFCTAPLSLPCRHLLEPSVPERHRRRSRHGHQVSRPLDLAAHLSKPSALCGKPRVCLRVTPSPNPMNCAPGPP